MPETIIYSRKQDEYLGNNEIIPCERLEGAGEVPDGAFQIERFESDQWTAWYRTGPSLDISLGDWVQQNQEENRQWFVERGLALPEEELIELCRESVCAAYYQEAARERGIW